MTEREYNLLYEMRAVVHALEMLRDITPTISQVVKDQELRDVVAQLDKWRREMNTKLAAACVKQGLAG